MDYMKAIMIVLIDQATDSGADDVEVRRDCPEAVEKLLDIPDIQIGQDTLKGNAELVLHSFEQAVS